MIVDDRRVICGSANLNDRSQLGERDSEIALCIEEEPDFEMVMDGKPYMASKMASAWRRRLMREHIGLMPSSTVSLERSEPGPNQLPAPIPNAYDFGSPEDQAVEDVLSASFHDVWAGTGMRNRAAFEKVFRPIPNNDIRSWKDYAEYSKVSAGIRVSPLLTSKHAVY
jgi:phospholipase D1/2